jgi:Tol biopolymer transport system component
MLRNLSDPTTEATVLVASGCVSSPAFSPDGRWLAYESEISGKSQVYLAPFEGAEVLRPVLVSTRDGEAPFWSRDSSELFYYATDQDGMGSVLMSAKIEMDPRLRVSTPTKILDANQFDESYLAPMDDGERFIFFNAPDRKPEEEHLIVVLNWATELRRQFKDR